MNDESKAPDFGPDIRQSKARGRIAGYVRTKSGKPALDKRGRKKPLIVTLRVPHVVREDRPDVLNPNETVRGARRRDGLLMMYRKGQLTGAQLTAAEAFRDDLAVTAGAKLSVPHESTVRAKRTDFHPNRLQIDAQTRCREAWALLSLQQRGVVTWVVISWGTIGGYAECARCRQPRITARLLAALDVLADYYSTKTGIDRGR